MIYLIADTHFGDPDIIKVCDRPFKDTKEMDDMIVSNWNDVVNENDTVYLLGDVGKLNRVHELNGIINLVKGNHDNQTIESYKVNGINMVYDLPIVLKEFFILSHEPISYIQPNGVFANIFGHVHNSPHITTYSNRHYCVSVERINYKPISLDDVIETMRYCGK